MLSVGLRELKNRLPEYVRRVRAGERILITDRGVVVAELAPPGAGDAASDPYPGLALLVQRGLATRGAPNDRAVYRRFKRVAPPGTAKRLLDAERDDDRLR